VSAGSREGIVALASQALRLGGPGERQH
jgi:hypothetical protein